MKMNHLACLVDGPAADARLDASCSARGLDAAPTTCKDGTTSTATGRGACSGHGGVQKPAGAAQRHLDIGAGSRSHSAARKRRIDAIDGTYDIDGTCDVCRPLRPLRSPPPRRQSIDRVRQYRSHRRHRQVQGRHLLEVSAPQRYLLEAMAASPNGSRPPLTDAWPLRRRPAALPLQQRLQRRPDIVEQLGLAGSVRVDAVGLHQIGGQGDAVQQEGHVGQLLVARQVRVRPG